MASTRPGDGQDRKASGYIGAAGSVRSKKSLPGADGQGGKDTLQGQASRKNRRGGAFVVDMVLIVLIVGVIVGGIFGYRALKQAYSVEWEEGITVHLVVELANVDPTIDLSKEDDMSVYFSSHVDADKIGVVTEVLDSGLMPSSTKDAASGNKYYRVAVEATARYRAGEGYYVGSESLLAGRGGHFRIGSYEMEGTLLLVTEQEILWVTGNEPTA